MEIDNDRIAEFKKALRKDSGLVLSDEEAKEAAENLINLFSFLYEWDLRDKQKLMQMKGSKNESRNL